MGIKTMLTASAMLLATTATPMHALSNADDSFIGKHIIALNKTRATPCSTHSTLQQKRRISSPQVLRARQVARLLMVANKLLTYLLKAVQTNFG